MPEFFRSSAAHGLHEVNTPRLHSAGGRFEAHGPSECEPRPFINPVRKGVRGESPEPLSAAAGFAAHLATIVASRGRAMFEICLTSGTPQGSRGGDHDNPITDRSGHRALGRARRQAVLTHLRDPRTSHASGQIRRVGNPRITGGAAANPISRARSCNGGIA